MFRFKGISSEDMNVIIEEEEHFLTKASQRYEMTEIEGRDGAIFDEYGYAVVDRPIKVQILDKNKLDLILAWLDGVGEFEYKGRITKARFYNEVIPERSANIKIADFTFIRNPFWNKKDDEFIEVGNFIYNFGNIYSEPIIRLEKKTSNNVDITINNLRFEYNFNNESYVEINSEEKTVLYDGLNRNRKIEMGYEFPILQTGENKVIINSGDVLIKVKRKDRWL